MSSSRPPRNPRSWKPLAGLGMAVATASGLALLLYFFWSPRPFTQVEIKGLVRGFMLCIFAVLALATVRESADQD